MTPAHEAIVLPLLFFSVALAGGVRPGAALAVEPPSLFALVLAVLLLGTLVQSGTLDPVRLASSSRPALANANGTAVLCALFVASAQLFTLLTATSGLPRAVMSVYFFVLMFQTLAAAPDRVRLLRSLGVTFGAAFVLKFVVLDALANPAGGRMGRALQVLLDGVTLGAIAQDPLHPGAGYIAFATVAAFLIGVWMLPSRMVTGRIVVQPPHATLTRRPPDSRA
jgi:hypothetical protein